MIWMMSSFFSEENIVFELIVSQFFDRFFLLIYMLELHRLIILPGTVLLTVAFLSQLYISYHWEKVNHF